MKDTNFWIVKPGEENKRLLTFLKEKLGLSNRSLRWPIEHQGCFINNVCERYGSRRLKVGDRVQITITEQESFCHEGRILFEDEWLMVYNKSAFVTSEALASDLHHLLVHRLDRDTTGALILAKSEGTRKMMEELFRRREVSKSYLAIVLGVPEQKEGRIENKIAPLVQREGEIVMGITSSSKGKLAITDWEKIASSDRFSLLKLYPKTGRTHQLRLHLSDLGYPIVGDVRYGTREKMNVSITRTLLHAQTIEWLHPIEKRKYTITAPLPVDFQEALMTLSILQEIDSIDAL